MSKQFYYQVMGEEFGPLTGIELREKSVAGDVTVDTPVRIGIDGEWVSAMRLKNLFDESGRPIPHEAITQTLLNASVFHEPAEEPARRGKVPSKLLLDAISFAARLHHGQTRQDDSTPKMAHAFRVVSILATGFGVDDPDVLAAAALHGAIDDTPIDHDELAAQFGERVAQFVAVLSRDKRLPGEQCEQAYLGQLANAVVEVKLCKLADVYDNLLDSAHLSKKNQTRSTKRAKQLLQRLTPDFPAEWEHVLELMRQLIEATSGGLIRQEGKVAKPANPQKEATVPPRE